MVGKSIFRKVSRFLFSLWAIASIVFLLSRFLPALYAPKGMLENGTAVYGQALTATTLKIKEAYYVKMGLNLPYFYVTPVLYSTLEAQELKPLPADKEWVYSYVFRHGAEATASFYSAVIALRNSLSDSEKTNLNRFLVNWADSMTHRNSNNMESQNRFLAVFKKEGLKQHNILAQQWLSLAGSEAPFYYYLPSMQWNGMNNQYHTWISNLVQGDLGMSLTDYKPVSEKIGHALIASGLLGFTGLGLALILSLLLGMQLISTPHYKVGSKIVRQFLFLLDSIPAFLLSLGIFILYLALGGSLAQPLYPVDGEYSIWPRLVQNSFFLALGATVLLILPYLTLQLARSLKEETGNLFMKTALAKGLSWKKAVRRHALPNALGAFLTLASEVLIGLLAGILVVEITFSLPGIGSLLSKSILASDYPVLIGITLFLLVFRLCVVWLTGWVHGLIDPRIR